MFIHHHPLFRSSTKGIAVLIAIAALTACGGSGGSSNAGAEPSPTPDPAPDPEENTPPVAYFSADDGVHGYELWKTDGTAEGTVMVKDIDVDFVPELSSTLAIKKTPAAAGPIGSDPSDFTTIGQRTYFIAETESHGAELWVTDGTEAGTTLVKDSKPGADDGLTKILGTVGDKLLLASVVDTSTYPEGSLWISDGTEAGTVFLADLITVYSGVSQVFTLGSTTLISANSETKSGKLWITDGTPAGTQAIDGSSGLNSASNGIRLGDKVYFIGNTDTHGSELWVSDGTEAGTQLVKDINSGSSGSNLYRFTVMDGKLYFKASDGTHGAELWTSDGTEAGTQLVNDINIGIQNGFTSTPLAHLGQLFFRGDDGVNGNQLWVSDGSEAGTVEREINTTGPAYVSGLTAVGASVVFSADDGIHGAEVWISDGTEAGTQLLKDIVVPDGSSTREGSYPTQFISLDSKAVFFAQTADGEGNHYYQPWVTDGTAEGTQLIKTINPNGDAVNAPI